LAAPPAPGALPPAAAAAAAAGGAPRLTDDELSSLFAPLAELLLLERQALRAYGERVKPYFRRAGAGLAAAAAPGRAAFLAARTREVGDPTVPGSMNGMPPPGRSGSLPAVFDGDEEGALHVSDGEADVVELLD
jgi:hypothetical protein